jgi:hypothetical protein
VEHDYAVLLQHGGVANRRVASDKSGDVIASSQALTVGNQSLKPVWRSLTIGIDSGREAVIR